VYNKGNKTPEIPETELFYTGLNTPI